MRLLSTWWSAQTPSSMMSKPSRSQNYTAMRGAGVTAPVGSPQDVVPQTRNFTAEEIRAMSPQVYAQHQAQLREAAKRQFYTGARRPPSASNSKEEPMPDISGAVSGTGNLYSGVSGGNNPAAVPDWRCIPRRPSRSRPRRAGDRGLPAGHRHHRFDGHDAGDPGHLVEGDPVRGDADPSLRAVRREEDRAGSPARSDRQLHEVQQPPRQRGHGIGTHRRCAHDDEGPVGLPVPHQRR